MSKIENLGESFEKTREKGVCDDNALIFVLMCEKSVTIKFFIYLRKRI
jgi:hypothetical protein